MVQVAALEFVLAQRDSPENFVNSMLVIPSHALKENALKENVSAEMDSPELFVMLILVLELFAKMEETVTKELVNALMVIMVPVVQHNPGITWMVEQPVSTSVVHQMVALNVVLGV